MIVLERQTGGYPRAYTLGTALVERPAWLLRAEDRFASKWIAAESGCHLWVAAVDRLGYTRFRVTQSRSDGAPVRIRGPSPRAH